MGVPAWAGRYIGIPFVEEGFDEAGCHCWGLVRLVMWRERSIELPRHGDISAGDLAAILRATAEEKASGTWVPVVGKPQPFDLQLMWAHARVNGKPIRDEGHVGIMLTETMMLHVEKATDSCAVPLKDVSRRLIAAYRHRELVAG
jgi:cell wall-associated NlpC family hydrolase